MPLSDSSRRITALLHHLRQGELIFIDNERSVSRQTISSLEKGRYNPSILLAFKIARCFGQSIEEIFLYEEDAQ